jgi:cytochrome c oxidase subunit II
MTEKFLPLFPVQASSVAAEVDALYFFLIALSAFFSILIAGCLIVFAIRFRRRSEDQKARPAANTLLLELVWTGVPLAIVMVIFAWGASLYFRMTRPPQDVLQMYAVGKQWMWKFQHPDGRREINQLHVPVRQPVKLTMSSEDVIHSFFVPAFRVKQDVVPGRYTTIWFEATKPGEYHLFCAEYCGTLHSGMIGQVVAMEPEDYQTWLAGGAAGRTMAQAGEDLFASLGCAACHKPGGLGPDLAGVAGSERRLASGATVSADDSYLRESILNPAAKMTEGYQPIMPIFQGQVSEEQVLQLIAYLKTLQSTKAP